MADRKRIVAEGRGSVYVGGRIYREGDEIPAGVKVGDHVFVSPGEDVTPSAATVLTQPLVSSIDGEQAEPVAEDFTGAQVPAQTVTVGAPDVDGEALIDGNEDEVLERVAGDEAKARAALDAEQAKDKPRKGVVERLTAIVGSSSG